MILIHIPSPQIESPEPTVIGTNFYTPYPSLTFHYFQNLFSNQTYHLIETTYSLISPSCGILTKNGAYETTTQFFGDFNVKIDHYSIIEVPIAIAVCNFYMYIYGHVIVDLIPNLLSLPYYLLKSGYFPLTGGYSEPESNFFEAIEFPHDHAIPVASDGALFSKKVYVYQEGTFEQIKPGLYYQFQKAIRKKFHILSDIFEIKSNSPDPKYQELPCNKYILVNRKENQNRRLSNFDDILSHIRKNYPQFKFEKRVEINNFQEQAYYYNQVRLIWGVHTSILLNSLYMRKNTVVCELQPNFINKHRLELTWCNVFYFVLGLGIKSVIARDPGIDWLSQNPSETDPNLVLSMIKEGLLFLHDINK